MEHILTYLLDKSPLKKLYVQIRCQGLEKENIIGTLSVDRFINGVIKSKLLLGNITYILSSTADLILTEYPIDIWKT